MKQQTLDISQWRTVTLERWKAKEMNPTMTQAYRWVSKLRHREKKCRQSPGVSLHWDEEAESAGRPRHLDFIGQRMWETNSRQKNMELSQQTTDHACTWENYSRTEENHPKETVPSIHIRWRAVPTLTARTGKSHDSWGTQKVLAQWWKIIHSKLFTSTALSHLTNLKSRIHYLQNYWRTTLYTQNLHNIVHQRSLSKKKKRIQKNKIVL